jgi:FkbM family methyltransferase
MRQLGVWCFFVVAVILGTACDRGDGILDSGEKLYSQYDEEIIIRHFFGDRRNGFFVDVGCGPPIKGSTTYYLEKHLGWSGIAVDAIADYAPSWQKERPRSRFFSYLVTDHADSLDSFYRAVVPGLSSTQPERTIHVPDGREVTITGKEIRIPTTTLDKLLEENGVGEIDFLSMDIEESEPPALAGFDIERFRPELVCIEAANTTRERIRRYFESHGYRQIEEYLERDPVNWYFEPKGG